jgi:hypothetical protein
LGVVEVGLEQWEQLAGEVALEQPHDLGVVLPWAVRRFA